MNPNHWAVGVKPIKVAGGNYGESARKVKLHYQDISLYLSFREDK